MGWLGTAVPGARASAGSTYPVPTMDLASVVLHTEDPSVIIEAALRRGFTFVHLSEVIAAMEGSGSLPPKPILLTYDDGRSQLYSVAHPVIVDYEIKANAFLTTDFVSQLSVDSTLQSQAPGITWTQAEEMHATGLYEWGNHTRTHTSLSTQSLAEQTDELGDCNEALLAELGVHALTVAYPNGNYDADTFQAMRANDMLLGFDFAASGKSKTDRYSNIWEHPYAINRSDNVGAGALDGFVDTVLVHWGWNVDGERNADNSLGFWTVPAGGEARDTLGEGVRIDNRSLGIDQTLKTTDYFRVKPGDILYAKFWSQTSQHTTGTGVVRLAQYDEDKAFLSYIDLKSYSASETYLKTETEVTLSDACKFVQFEMNVDASFNGLLNCKNMLLKRAYP